jgi:signal recognition particle GTPase
LYIVNLREPEFDQTMINNLVMDEERLRIIKSLAASYVREDRHGKLLAQPSWQADFVEGKGKGQIFLLHGKPGVGKTYTAGKLHDWNKWR